MYIYISKSTPVIFFPQGHFHRWLLCIRGRLRSGLWRWLRVVLAMHLVQHVENIYGNIYGKTMYIYIMIYYVYIYIRIFYDHVETSMNMCQAMSSCILGHFRNDHRSQWILVGDSLAASAETS